jgi:hypothetical protein
MMARPLPRGSALRSRAQYGRSTFRVESVTCPDPASCQEYGLSAEVLILMAHQVPWALRASMASEHRA